MKKMLYKSYPALQRGLIAGFALSGLIMLASPVHAEECDKTQPQEMELTSTAEARGFTCSTFADEFIVGPGRAGPLDVAFIAPFEFPGTGDTGDVLVTERSTGRVRVFPTDRDGQHAGSTPGVLTGPDPAYGLGNAAGVARLFGAFYLAQQTEDRVIQIAPDGTFIDVVAGGIDNATGIVADPANSRLFVSQAGGSPNVVYEVNPFTQTKDIFLAEPADGLEIASTPAINLGFPVLYLARADGIRGYDIATQELVFNSGPIAGITGGPDGVVAAPFRLVGASLASATVVNPLYVNTTGGQLVEIDVGTNEQTVIGTGGSRGDFIRLSPSGCFLLLSQSDRVLNVRLPNTLFGPCAGGGMEPPPPPPPPTTSSTTTTTLPTTTTTFAEVPPPPPPPPPPLPCVPPECRVPGAEGGLVPVPIPADGPIEIE
ncbi:MAG: hypothetical protein ACREXS_12560 [Gammaproteobacteria bacterium]